MTDTAHPDDVFATYGRRLGHKPNPVDPRDWRVAASVAGGYIPPSASLVDRVLSIKDQGPTASCVGQAFAQAVDVRARVMGHPLKAFPSAQAIYTVARQVLSGDGPLVDDGTFPRTAVKAMADFGVVGEDRVPFDPATINYGVFWDVLRAGSSNRVVDRQGLHYLSGYGILDVKRALAGGFPVAFGMQVDDAFMNYRGGFYQRGGRELGGHMMCAVGYESGIVHVVNSWGVGWGDGGFVHIPEDHFNYASIVFDITVVDVVPEALR